MYSPRIRDEHIPALYRLARSRGITMTALVDEAVGALLAQEEAQAAIAAMAIPPKAQAAPPGASRTRRHDRVRRAGLDTAAR
jgi:hypothetical protein